MEVQYTNTKDYGKSLYGFEKTGSIEEKLERVRQEKKDATKARNDRLKKEWMIEPPKAAIPMNAVDQTMYSVNDYLEGKLYLKFPRLANIIQDIRFLQGSHFLGISFRACLIFAPDIAYLLKLTSTNQNV